MKKFYSFLFAAAALVGFAACNSDSTEDQPAPAGAEKLSFKANIDTTKTDLDANNKTTWCKDDVVVIEGFEFKCGDDLATFTCTQTSCTSLLNKEVEAVYSKNKDGKIDSKAGVHGALLTATGTLTATATFNFAVQNAFLKFTTTGTVTLKADKEIFSTGKELTITEAGEHYVAINPVEAKLSVLSFGATIKTKTLEFERKKIYNLGELSPLEASEWKTTGTNGSWPEDGNVQLYTLNDFAVAYNVNITNNGFKFTKGSWSTAVGSHSGDAKDAYDFTGGWYGGKTPNSENIIMKNFTAGHYDIFFCTKDNSYLVLPSSTNSAPNLLSLIGVVNGSDWNTDYDFEKDGDNKYVLRNVTINGEFKIRREHIWGNAGSNNWGGNQTLTKTDVLAAGENLKVNENGLYDIELTVSTSNGHIYPTAIKAIKK